MTDAKGVALDFRMRLRRQGIDGARHLRVRQWEPPSWKARVAADQLDYAWRWGTEYFGRGKMNSLANGALQGTWGYPPLEGGGTLSATPR